MTDTTALFLHHLDPCWQRVLVVGATSNVLLRRLLTEIKPFLPHAKFFCLHPAGLPDQDLLGYDELITSDGENIQCSDLMRLPSFDAVFLAIGHVARTSYPVLCQTIDGLSSNIFLFSGLGLQPLDMREANDSWPQPVTAGKSNRKGSAAETWIFFRPSDQTAYRMAERFEQEGKTIWQVETLKAFEELLPKAQAVFFDWCLTDYRVLFEAVSSAKAAGLWTEAFLALDLVDVCEDIDLAARLEAINRTALQALDRVHYLFTRDFLVKRYQLDCNRSLPTGNLYDPIVWRDGISHKNHKRSTEIRFVYHGLFYFWHEVAEFGTIYRKLIEQHPARFELFGRIHESIRIGGVSLFPSRELAARNLLNQMKEWPGVRIHGYCSPPETRQAITESDYYVGITAGNSLMSKTEIRTGVLEAMQCNTPVLHQQTPGLTKTYPDQNRNIVTVDAHDPDQAVNRILATDFC